MKMLGFRRTDTGFLTLNWRTENDVDLCAVRATMPAFGLSLVTVEAGAQRYESEFDMENTLFPGLTRFVYDAAGREAWRLVLSDRSGLGILCGGMRIEAVPDGDTCTFALAGRTVGTLRDVGIRGATEGLWYVADVARTDLLLPMLSFPLMRFGC